MWRKAEDRIKDLNCSEGQQGILWLGDIWMTNVKQGVQDFYSYVSESITGIESEDKFEELFSDTAKKTVLNNRLLDLTGSFKKYSESEGLLSKSRKAHESIKTWTLRTILSLFLIAVWGAIGFLFENVFSSNYTIVYWIGFAPFLVLLLTLGVKLARTYEICCKIDSQIMDEKSKHADALGVKL